jgi:demethoxyubiquinone hydroxylase (CLK1/Coq7/Cat5 family)
MARTAHIPHFQLPAGSSTLRRASRGSPLGALLYALSFIGAAALRVGTPVVKGFYSGLIDAQQRRADARIWEIAQSDPRLKAELIALRERAESTD